MDYQVYRWIVPVVALYFVTRLIRQLLKKKRSLRSAAIWFTWWTTIAVLAVVPDAVSEKLATTLGFADNVNAVIFVSLGMLFLFTFYYSTSIERMQKQMTQMVRDQSLQDAMREAERYRYEKQEGNQVDAKDDEDSLRA